MRWISPLFFSNKFNCLRAQIRKNISISPGHAIISTEDTIVEAIKQSEVSDAPGGVSGPVRNKRGRFFVRGIWRMAEWFNSRRIEQSQKCVRNNLDLMRRQLADISDKSLLEDCIQYNAGVIEALKKHIEASEVYAGSAEESWICLLQDVEGVQKKLIERRNNFPSFVAH